MINIEYVRVIEMFESGFIKVYTGDNQLWNILNTGLIELMRNREKFNTPSETNMIKKLHFIYMCFNLGIKELKFKHVSDFLDYGDGYIKCNHLKQYKYSELISESARELPPRCNSSIRYSSRWHKIEIGYKTFCIACCPEGCKFIKGKL